MAQQDAYYPPLAWVALFADADEAQRYIVWRATVPAPDGPDPANAQTEALAIEYGSMATDATAFWNNFADPVSPKSDPETI